MSAPLGDDHEELREFLADFTLESVLYVAALFADEDATYFADQGQDAEISKKWRALSHQLAELAEQAGELEAAEDAGDD